MKRSYSPGWLIGIFILLVSVQPVNAQKPKDIFSPETPLIYLGVDFSEARVIGEPVTKASDLPNFFVGINNQIINESKKYDLPGAFHRSAVSSDISAVLKKCAGIDPGTIKSDNVNDINRLKKDHVYKIVKGYDFGNLKGIGVLFIMGGMSKSIKEASMYVTFFDIASKKVLLTEQMNGKGGGFSFRNYWLTAIYNVMNKIEKTKYNEWKANNS